MNEVDKSRLDKLQYTMLIVGLAGTILGVYSTYLQIKKMKLESKEI